MLGVLFLLASAGFGGAAHPGLLQTTLSWLGMIKILLGLFNLLPPFPWANPDDPDHGR